jgi:hypothetical protein
MVAIRKRDTKKLESIGFQILEMRHKKMAVGYLGNINPLGCDPDVP